MGIRRGERTSHAARAAGLDPPNPASAVAQARPTTFAATAGAGRARVDAGKVSRRSSVGYDDREGRFLYATPVLAAYLGMTPDQLIGRTWYEIGVPPEAVQALEEVRRRVLETGQPAKHKTSLQIGGTHRESEFVFKPAIGADGSIVGTVVTAWDASEHGPTSRGRARLDRTYSILSAIDQVILRARSSHVILSEACRIAADVGGFELAWAGLVDPATGDVRVVCQAGRDEGLLADVVVSARDEPSGHGVVGTAIRENRSVVIQDVRRDERMVAWRSFFDQLGYRTAAGFPIRAAGRTIGALALYSATASHFDAASARLYEQLAEDQDTNLRSCGHGMVLTGDHRRVSSRSGWPPGATPRQGPERHLLRTLRPEQDGSVRWRWRRSVPGGAASPSDRQARGRRPGAAHRTHRSGPRRSPGTCRSRTHHAR